MSIYDIQGTSLASAYGISGTSLTSAYDVNGNDVMESGGEHRDWGTMTDDFKTALNSSMNYIQNYVDNHSSVFAFPVFTDVHTYFSWNEPNYVAYNKPDLFPVFLMLGDMTNTYNTTELDGAVDYMEGASNQIKLVSVGNHEWGGYDTTGSDPYPKTWYDDLLPASCVFFADDGLTYYYDDAENNVRYIMLDSNSTVKKQSGVQLYDMSAMNWLASVLETAGTKDIILMNHAMGSGFYLVTDTEKTDWKSDTGITNIGTMNNIVNAFINRSTISVTVDGVANAHDFSNATGDFIGYITGHYHNAGYTDTEGFNKWTCPALIKNNLTNRGMSFFVVDKDLRKVQFIVARILTAEYELYEYSY